MSSRRYPTPFATNPPPPGSGPTVADAINDTLRQVAGYDDYSVAIASAYFNLGGWLAIADELRLVPRVRLLLGVAPDPTADQTGRRVTPSPDPSSLEEWIKTERDRVAFTTEDEQHVRALIKWLRDVDGDGRPRVEVRRPTGAFLYGKAFIVENPLPFVATLVGSANLTYAGLKRNKELVVGSGSSSPETTDAVIEWFDTHWDSAESFNLADLFDQRIREHPPELIYARMLAEYYGQGLEADTTFGGVTDMSLTDWQKAGAETAFEMMQTYGGALLADDVGLGKTHTAAKVISHYTRRRERGVGAPWVLVVCPAAMESTWRSVLHDQGVASRVEVLSYDKARRQIHDDVDAFDKYAMVVCDEAHHLRNPHAKRTKEINRLIAGNGTPKHALMMTATPVNNGIGDLESIISLAVRDDETFRSQGITSLRNYFNKARRLDRQAALRPEHVEQLMDAFTVRYTRRFVERTYPDTELDDGTVVRFPERRIVKLKYNPDGPGQEVLTELERALIGDPDEYEDTDGDYIRAGRLIFALYRPNRYGARARQWELGRANAENMQEESVTDRFTDGFLRTLLLKRLDSSLHALFRTLARMEERHSQALQVLRRGLLPTISRVSDPAALANLFDDDEDDSGDGDGRDDDGLPGRGYNLQAMRRAVEHDLDLLRRLRDLAEVAQKSDPKRLVLAEYLRNQAAAAKPISKKDTDGRMARKTLVFTESADSAVDLAKWIAKKVEGASPDDHLSKFKGRVSGEAVTGRNRKQHADLIDSFDPAEAQKGRDRYDLIISTDTLAEGVNLQAAGRCINYDLPWNPMRVVQRFGRVDRLRSPHSKVDLRCFYPGDRVDDWLRLLRKLNQKLSAADAAVGVEEILPSDHPASGGKTFNEEQSVREGNEDLASLIDNEIDRQARSPQEMRYQLDWLRNELGSDIDELPHTAGSGFVNPSASVTRPAYVFCLRVGEDGPVWFRTVFCDDDWNPLTSGSRQADETLRLEFDSHEETVIDDHHSKALMLADPDPDDEGPALRHLPNHVYAGAFTAWKRAQADAHAAYERKLLEEQSTQPPEAFKKVSEELEHLGQRSKPVRDRLATVPLSKKPEEEITKKLKEHDKGHRSLGWLLEAVERVLDEHGIVAKTHRDVLEHGLRSEDVRLICWQAVSPERVGIR